MCDGGAQDYFRPGGLPGDAAKHSVSGFLGEFQTELIHLIEKNCCNGVEHANFGAVDCSSEDRVAWVAFRKDAELQIKRATRMRSTCGIACARWKAPRA